MIICGSANTIISPRNQKSKELEYVSSISLRQLSVHHHLDQPIMSIREIDISVGTESQVAVATTLTTTTEEAKRRFDPGQRGCYFEGELTLKYLPREYYRWVLGEA